ncbi:MATH domain-containing protein [Caenorhabditis elegans]|uniref:MATH domain-containing protein n=1 Tax=Caenorhabditis elegans TaxID=6239 RepID=P91300_CAEEL|nr:MATH domain-containing protein [Caenorhabditis elegans]CCD63728.1 MATH domain-containing protein [Caenorhabditis elegans]|eukprot:NP_494075.1 MATH (meprin-associated Traf homology) domain containing [Caenorhabditis elegans]
MSLSKCEFSMEYTIKNVSKFSAGEIQFSDETIWRNLIWKLKISKLDDFLGVSVYCSQTSNTWIKDCQIVGILECKIVSDNGETHEGIRLLNMKPPRKIEGPMIDFREFLKWDEMKKNFLTADSVKIVVIVNNFTALEDIDFLCGFKILHTFKHLARFEENETQFSDSKEWAGTSWRICVKKEEGYLGCYLQCESNPNTSLICVSAICELRIKSKENYEIFDLDVLEFSRPTMLGNSKLMKWEDLISNYLVSDSVTIEADLEAYNEFPVKNDYMAKKFVLSQQFYDVSRIEEGESRFSAFEKRFNIPWRIELKRVSGFLEIHLHCGENATFLYHQIETDCWFNLVSTNGKHLMRQMSAVFCRDVDMESLKKSLKKVIRWDDMMTDYVINDSFIIEAHIEILSIIEEACFWPYWITEEDAVFHERSFYISCKVNNVSRFLDDEKQWGNTELRYEIPWRIQAKRTYDFLEMYLFCDGEGNGLDQLIKTEVTCNLVSTNGNNFRRTSKLCFEKPGGQGIIKFIKWNDMIESFLNPLEDSLIVEAHVKIFMVEEFSRRFLQNERSFLMSHTVRDVSSAEEGNVVFSATEEWYDVQWSISMKYINGFVELLLSCDKDLNAHEAWSIETNFQLILVGANGKRLTDYFEHTFEKPDSIGDSKLIRWEDMLDQYAVEDSLTVEARVNFTLLIEPQPEYSFIMCHTVKKLSNVREGEFHFSKTETHCDAPWRISLKKEEACILIYLHCDKLLSNDENWSIQVEVQLVLGSETGRTLTDKVTHIFNEPEGIHWTKDLTWEDLERDFMVDDSVKIEARVKIVKPVEIDNEDEH